MTDQKQRGGPGRGQGRKPVKQGEETVTVSLRMTPEQRAKLARLGGAEWVRTKIDKARQCIEATGSLNAHGYGHVRYEGKVVRAHRLAYAQAHGLTLEDIAGRIVRHACDNPACINPAHLVLGTHTDNMRDMAERGRNRQPKGIRNAKSKLSDADVIEIRRRAAAGETNKAIAKDYGIAPSQISRIHTRKTWGHLA